MSGNLTPSQKSPAPSPAATLTTARSLAAERVRGGALVAFTVALLALCVLVAIPFLPAITWSVALAIIAWPLHRWVRRWLSPRKLAAGLSTLIVILVITGSGLFVAYQLAHEAVAAADGIQESQRTGEMRRHIAEIPGMSPVVAWMDRVGVDIEVEIRKLVAGYTRDASQLAQGSLAAITQLLVIAFILFHLFMDPVEFRTGLRDLLPLTQQECDDILQRATDSVHANLYANMLTSLIDAVGGGLAFWFAGVSQGLLWASVMFVLGFLPVVGAGLVWVPVALSLAFHGEWGGSLIVASWGIATFIFVDNILYFRLVGTRLRMPEALMLLAFLGGLAVFGISGMILGPAILAVTVALLQVWKQRLALGRDLHVSEDLPLAAEAVVAAALEQQHAAEHPLNVNSREK